MHHIKRERDSIGIRESERERGEKRENTSRSRIRYVWDGGGRHR
jgi:hypothetical protein